MRSRKRLWTDDEIRQLTALVAAGGSPARAAAKFKRSIAVCRTQARVAGMPFTPLRDRRRIFSAKCAAAERALEG
jgi:hypothetical protein